MPAGAAQVEGPDQDSTVTQLLTAVAAEVDEANARIDIEQLVALAVDLDAAIAAGTDVDANNLERFALGIYYANGGPPAEDRDWIEVLDRAWSYYVARGGEIYASYLADSLRLRHEGVGDYERALAVSDLARAGLDPLDPFALTFAVSGADYARATGDLDGALERSATLLALDLPDYDRSRILGIRAQAMMGVGVLDLAALDVAESVRVAEAIFAASVDAGAPDVRALEGALYRAAELNILLQRFDEVVRLIERLRGLDGVSDVFVTLSDFPLGLALLERAHRARAAGEDVGEVLGAARQALRASLALSESRPMEALIARISLADVARLRGEAAEARELIDRARVEYADRVGDDEGSAAARVLGLLEVVDARLCLAAGEGLDRALGRVHVAYDRLLGAWAATPVRAGGIGFLQERVRRAVLTTLCDLELAVHGSRPGAGRAFEALLRSQSMNTVARLLRAQGVTLEQVRSLLPAGGGLLAFLPGVDVTYAFALDAEVLTCDPLAPGAVLRAQVDRFNLDFRAAPRGGDGELTRIAADASELTTRLLPPDLAARVGGWSSVAVLGSELLADLPAEVLGDAPDAALGRSLALARWPSAAVVAEGVARAVPARERPLVILSAPSTSPRQAERWPTLVPLPPAGTAAAELGERLGLDPSHSFTGDDADRRALERAGREATITAVLAHGLFDATRERPAGLLLADTEGDGGLGAWYCADLEGTVASPVVLLLTCGGARGPRRLGDDGTTHLGGSFLAAGSRAVVVASTEVSYLASLIFGESFVRALADGASVAAAATVGRAAVAADARFVHPFHWGAFQVLGDGSYRPFAASGELAERLAPAPNGTSATPLAVGGVALVVLLVAVVAIRRRGRATRPANPSGER